MLTFLGDSEPGRDHGVCEGRSRAASCRHCPGEGWGMGPLPCAVPLLQAPWQPSRRSPLQSSTQTEVEPGLEGALCCTPCFMICNIFFFNGCLHNSAVRFVLVLLIW